MWKLLINIRVIFYDFINTIPDSEGILLEWVTGGFVIGPVEFASGWLFIKRAPLWFNVGAYIWRVHYPSYQYLHVKIMCVEVRQTLL